MNLTGLHSKSVTPYVLVYVLSDFSPDDVIKYVDSARLISDRKEYVTYTGCFKNVPLSIASTGSGGPSVATALEELSRAGARTFIRIGACGTPQKEIEVGDLIVSTSAVREDGCSGEYVYPTFPATSNHEVICALIDAIETLGFRYHLGVTYSYGTIYPGTGRATFRGFHPYSKWSSEKEFVSSLTKMGVVSTDMETSMILTFCTLFNLRGGSVCYVVSNRATGDMDFDRPKDAVIRVALEALYLLFKWDQIKKKRGRKYLSPGLFE
ncbi:MAG: nucleoside phosphorylase [Candidatus Bathyarchaeia archaeon]